jgi:hypothetical protein
VVVLDITFCPDPDKTGWSGFRNRTVRLGGCRKMVLASILVSASAPGTLSCSATTSSVPFSVSGFTSSLVEVSLLDPVCPWLLLGLSVEDPSFGTSSSCRRLGVAADFEEKPDGPICHSKLFGFPSLRSSCPTCG